MKAKLINDGNDIDMFDEIAAKAQHDKFIAEYGCGDAIIQQIKAVPEALRGQNDTQLLELRQHIDAQYKQVLDQHADYKDYVMESPPTISGRQGLRQVVKETDTQIIRTYEVLDADPAKVQDEINELQKQLAATDHKVIKTYEARLLNEPDPYDDIASIIQARRELRTQINELEKLL